MSSGIRCMLATAFMGGRKVSTMYKYVVTSTIALHSRYPGHSTVHAVSISFIDCNIDHKIVLAFACWRSSCVSLVSVPSEVPAKFVLVTLITHFHSILALLEVH